MCFLVFSYNQHSKYKLIFAGNRDEIYSRPTKDVSWWEDAPNILAGKDLKMGGTWLGITKQGRFATITTFRDNKHKVVNGPSRGNLVKDYLINDIEPIEYIKQISQNSKIFDGYNLLVGNMSNNKNKIVYYSNKKAGYQILKSGIYGLSNSFLNTPWPKVKKGMSVIKEIISKYDENPYEKIFNLLKDKEIYPDEHLPDTGIGIDKERILSSIFIKEKDYGTRASTIITISYDNIVRFEERTYDNLKKSVFTFKID